MKQSFSKFAIALLIVSPIVVSGLPIPREIIKVPIDRLIRNLEKQVQPNAIESDFVTPGEEFHLSYPLKEKSIERNFKVRPDGMVALQGLGEVKISEMTLPETKKLIGNLLLTNPPIVPYIEINQTKQQRHGRVTVGETARQYVAIARLHAMAFALKSDNVPVARGDDWPFDYEMTMPVKTNSTKKLKDINKAMSHLTNAIENFQLSLKRNPTNAVAFLGLGWCHEQVGEKDKSLASYREALDLVRQQTNSEPHHYERRISIAEIAYYFRRLLDRERDKEELAQIENDLKEERRRNALHPRAISPILIPLKTEADLSELVDASARVLFDLDGSGLQRRWGWLTPKAGWLVYDHDGSGQITSGLQLFGNVTFWIFWQNGYHALAALDNDGDGVLRGDELASLALWHDANSDGISQLGEVRTLSAYGITALACDYVTHVSGIPYSPRGVTLRDGSTRPSYDWFAPNHAEPSSRLLHRP